MYANCMQMKTTIVTVLDTRHEKKSGVYPIKLRITFQRTQKYYPVGADLTKDEYKLMETLSEQKGLKTFIKRKLQDALMKSESAKGRAYDVISKMPQFSFRLFDKKFLSGQVSSESVYYYFDETIKQMKADGRMGTASNYGSSVNSLKEFSPKLLLRDVTVEFLKDYEKWLLADGKSSTTVGIYLRPLRAIINQAIEEGTFSRENYPFGKRRYQIPASRNIKKALTLEEIAMIAKYEASPGTWYEQARDMFLFSYYGNGINMKDILQLKYANIEGDHIRFVRAKTKFTNRTKSIPISIYLLEELKVIIERWGNKDKSPENYIFPVLEENTTPLREQRLIQQFTKMVNTYLKEIVKDLKINKPVTTYYARHSFATVLKKSGTNPLFISEALGHSSLKTTENYLASFEDEQRKAIVQQLRPAV